MHLKASSSLSCCQSRRPFGQLSVRHAPLRSTRSGISAVPQAALRSAAVAAATQGTVSAPGAPSPGFVAHLAGRSGAQQQRPRLQPVRVQQMDDPRAVASAKEGNVGLDDLIKYFGITVGIAVAAAAGAMYIDTFSTEPCTVAHTCDTIGTGIKVALVATHLYTFLLVPATMYVFYDKIQSLKDQGARSPFTALVGLGYIMVAIAGEIGWHVTQDWYYKEEYAVLNLCFYIFLVLGLSMWAYGIRIIPPSSGINAASGSETNSGLIETIEELSDKFLFAAPVLTGGFYLAGAAVLDTKVPIYILMLLVFVVLTGRFYNLLKTPWVLLFPLFSVGVNLGFIGLLDKYQQDAFLNPLFHILHDAAGTELGIAIIAVLVYLEPMRLKEQQQQKQLK